MVVSRPAMRAIMSEMPNQRSNIYQSKFINKTKCPAPSTETMDQIYKKEKTEKKKLVEINLKGRKYKTMTGSIWDLGLVFE